MKKKMKKKVNVGAALGNSDMVGRFVVEYKVKLYLEYEPDYDALLVKVQAALQPLADSIQVDKQLVSIVAIDKELM